NGLDGCNFIALLCKRNSATKSAVSFFSGMAQIYRIYVNDKRLIITSDPEKAYPPDCKKITEKNLLPVLAGMINGNDLANFVLLAPAPDKILDRLKTGLHFLEAAGGLVRNQH